MEKKIEQLAHEIANAIIERQKIARRIADVENREYWAGIDFGLDYAAKMLLTSETQELLKNKVSEILEEEKGK